jgi:hypothetical protein
MENNQRRGSGAVLREKGSHLAHRGEKRVEKVTDAFKDAGTGTQS